MKKSLTLITLIVAVVSLWGCNSIISSPKEDISKVLNTQSLTKAKDCVFNWSWKNIKLECQNDPFTFLLYKDISTSTWDLVAKSDLTNDLASTKSFVGIGISITNTDKWVLVDDIYTDNWLSRWDYILKVNWKKVSQILKAVKLIKWPAWTKVKLTIKRDWKILNIIAERKKISLKQYEQKIIQYKGNQYGYLKINNISNEIYSQVKPILKWFKAVWCKWIILDLRNNGGGYMNEAININKLWAKKGQIVLKVEELNNWKLQKHSFVAKKNWFLSNFPTVILVNGYTASAWEIITAGIKENNVWTTKLVWTKTFGKWTIQTIVSINQNFDLKYTIWKWYTPSWNNVCKKWLTPWKGLIPDINIELNTKLYKSKLIDNQLEKAKEVLNNLIKNN